MGDTVLFWLWVAVAIVDLISMLMGNPANWILVFIPLSTLLMRLAVDAFGG